MVHIVNCKALSFSTAVAVIATGAPPAYAAPPVPEVWTVIVNNAFDIPESDLGSGSRQFNSYNPPSVNEAGLVVFRARSTGQQQGPFSGIYVRDMDSLSEVVKIADRRTEVPEPNNTLYPAPGDPNADVLSMFNEFPAFPRIALQMDSIATRGNHLPVWTYVIGVDPSTGEDIETRVGTNGIYANLGASDPSLSPLVTSTSLLGDAPGFDLFSVPDAPPETRFDVFPGAPAITDENIIAFKGNYSVPDPEVPTGTLSKTGVYFRQITAAALGGMGPIHRVASSDTIVPNRGACTTGTTFGSTAPPSAADGRMVFVGLDNEDAPTCGGIYSAPLEGPPEQLTTLVGIETPIPGEGGATFSRLGEGLSYDGRFIGFWGAWGTATKTLRLYCPEEGNQDRRDFCNNTGDYAFTGDPNSVCDDETDDTDRCYQEREIPVNQGIFVYDTRTDSLQLLARTDGLGDFLFWNYSGMPPGAGESEEPGEPPRWRSSAFVAISAAGMPTVLRAAFLARTGAIDPTTNLYVNPLDGVYITTNEPNTSIEPLVETGMPGTLLDPEAVWDDDENPATPDVPLPITSLALERDGFRGERLAISASMGVEEAGWAGLYLANLPQPHATLLAGGTLRLFDRSRVDAELVTAETAELNSQVVVAADLEANLARFLGQATIDGDLRVDDIAGQQLATITGTLTVDVPIDVPSVDFVEVVAGSTPVVVLWDRTATLPPGSYGTARFFDRSTVHLSTGDYAFQSFEAGSDVTFVLDAEDGPVNIDVVGFIRFGDRNEFFAPSAEAFPAFVYTNASATFGFDGFYQAFVSAQGNISIRDRTDFVGAAQSSSSVTVGHDTTVLQP